MYTQTHCLLSEYRYTLQEYGIPTYPHDMISWGYFTAYQDMIHMIQPVNLLAPEPCHETVVLSQGPLLLVK